MRSYLFLLAICIIPFLGKSQTYFSKHYGTGGSESMPFGSIQLTSDGGFILPAGASSLGAGSGDNMLIKVTSSGNIQWTKTYGGTGNEAHYAVCQTNDGGYLITGYSSSFGVGNADWFITKTNGSGDTIWNKTIGSVYFDVGKACLQSTTGDFFIAGQITDTSGTQNKWHLGLVKLQNNGDTVWFKTYQGSLTGDMIIEGMIQTSDGNLVLIGSQDIFGPIGSQGFAIKINTNGGIVWGKRYYGWNQLRFKSLYEASNNDLIICGDAANSSYTDGLVVRLASNGSLKWANIYPNSTNLKSVIETSTGEIVTLGINSTSKSPVLKLNSSGNLLFTKLFIISTQTLLSSVRELPDQTLMLGGNCSVPGSGTEVWLVRADSNIAYACSSMVDTCTVTPYAVTVTSDYSSSAISYEWGVYPIQVMSQFLNQNLICTCNSTQNDYVNICQGDSYYAGGAWQTSTGIYTDSLQNYQGCDSVIHTYLTVNPGYVLGATIDICEGDSFYVENAWQTTTGVYTDGYLTTKGCDSIIITTLNVHAPSASFSGLAANYCDNDPSAVHLTGNPAGGFFSGTGISGSSFYPMMAGLGNHLITYEYTDGYGCTDIDSQYVNVSVCTSLDELVANSGFSVYPNPSNGTLNIMLSESAGESRIELFDYTGRLVLQTSTRQSKLELQGLAKGIYMLRVSEANGQQHAARVIVQ